MRPQASSVQCARVLVLFPFVAWLASATSVTLLAMLLASGELRPRGGVLVLAWLLAAAYCQFLGGSALVAAVGLALQTVLAIGLIVRWRLSD